MNSGASEFAKIQAKAQQAFDLLDADPRYKSFAVSTTGHSLGGGMAQAFALKNGLDSQVYNSLPIASATLTSGYFGPGGYEAALAKYIADGHAVDDIRTPNDIATFYYSRESAGIYLSDKTGQDVTMLPGAFMPAAIKTALLAGATPVALAAFGINVVTL